MSHNEMSSPKGTKYARFGTLSLLYFVQGAPYGFQTACLPLILRQSGLSFSKLGAMKLLFIPWVCKPLYAPIIERTRTKQWWLLGSMLVLGFTCLLAAFTTTEHQISVLAFILFLLNLASATQDICVDSLALKILEPSELGAGNTIQVVAYKAGSVFAGGSLLYVKDLSSWPAMWMLFGSIYFLCVGLVYGLGLVQERTSGMRSTMKPSASSFSLVKESLACIFRVKGTMWMVCFVLFYKLCERGEGTLPIYLVDKGVPMSKLAFWNGIVRSIASVSGSSFGGYLLSSQSEAPDKVLRHFSKLRCFPIIFQFLLISLWGSAPFASYSDLDSFSWDSLLFYLAILSLCAANFIAGVLTTAAFTAMMTLSQSAPEEIQSSHYSLLATMEVLGKLSFATVSGMLIDKYGLDVVFVLFVTFALLTIPLMWFMPSTETSAKKESNL